MDINFENIQKANEIIKTTDIKRKRICRGKSKNKSI